MNRIYLLLFSMFLALISAAPYAGEKLFVESAVVNDDGTVTLPLFEGRSHGKQVWFILTESSDGEFADDFGINRAQKLENARDTAAVQQGFFDSNDILNFTATVDFSPERIVVPDPITGFPPLEAEPGSVGESGYSPVVQLPDGTLLNATHVANDTGVHDRVVSLDVDAGSVRYDLVDGFTRDEAVFYITTDSSSFETAALEGVTFAPALNAAPFVGGDGTDSARASLAAITNGQTGADNPQRQGLNSVLLGDGDDPLNMLAWFPNQGRYSPLWDVHETTFIPGVTPTLQGDFFEIEDLADDDIVTAPDGSPWGPSDVIVNCPIIMQLDD